jgi:hypothetical protein
VIVGSDTLYVIGGIDGEGTAQGNIHVLNVTTMTWLRNDGFTNTYDQNVTVPHVEGVRAGLAAGAIAGIVIGCVAAVSLPSHVKREGKGLIASLFLLGWTCGGSRCDSSHAAKEELIFGFRSCS